MHLQYTQQSAGFYKFFIKILWSLWLTAKVMLLGDFDIIKVLQSANILNCMSLSIALLCNANLVHKILQDGGHYANICHVQCWLAALYVLCPATRLHSVEGCWIFIMHISIKIPRRHTWCLTWHLLYSITTTCLISASTHLHFTSGPRTMSILLSRAIN